MSRPRCRIKASPNYNLIDFQKRIFIKDFYLGFKKFNRLIDYRQIPNWYLPLVIMQPVIKGGAVGNVVYCKCHSIYFGVPEFNIGKMMVDLARTPQACAGGNELLGSIYIGKENPYDTLSVLSEKLKRVLPPGFKEGRIPKDVQEGALRMVVNPTLYREFGH